MLGTSIVASADAARVGQAVPDTLAYILVRQTASSSSIDALPPSTYSRRPLNPWFLLQGKLIMPEEIKSEHNKTNAAEAGVPDGVAVTSDNELTDQALDGVSGGVAKKPPVSIPMKSGDDAGTLKGVKSRKP
jgi:hypothetical protein